MITWLTLYGTILLRYASY